MRGRIAAILLVLSVLGAGEADPLGRLLAEADGAAGQVRIQLAWREATPADRVRILQAVRDRRDGELRHLAMDGLASADQAVVTASAHLLAVLPVADADEVARIRGLLSHADPAIRQAALAVAAGWDDAGAALAVLGWLDEGDASLRLPALAAVRRLVPVDLPADPTAWPAWFAQDQARYDAVAGAALDAFQDGRTEQIVDGLRRIGAERNHRHLAPDVIAPLLTHPNAEVVQAARRALTLLRGPEATLLLAQVPERAPEPVAAPPPVVVPLAMPASGPGPLLVLAGIIAVLVGWVVWVVRRPGTTTILAAPAAAAAGPSLKVTRTTEADGTRRIRRVMTFADGHQVAVTRRITKDGQKTVTRRLTRADGHKSEVVRAYAPDGTVTVTRSIRKPGGVKTKTSVIKRQTRRIAASRPSGPVVTPFGHVTQQAPASDRLQPSQAGPDPEPQSAAEPSPPGEALERMPRRPVTPPPGPPRAG
jgi:hypothetical protein